MRKAGPGRPVAYALPSTAGRGQPRETVHPNYWKATGPGTLTLYGAGTLQTRFTLPAAAHYGIWLQGSIGRPLNVYLDGGTFGGSATKSATPSSSCSSATPT